MRVTKSAFARIELQVTGLEKIPIASAAEVTHPFAILS
jgi:hypothetical protein